MRDLCLPRTEYDSSNSESGTPDHFLPTFGWYTPPLSGRTSHISSPFATLFGIHGSPTLSDAAEHQWIDGLQAAGQQHAAAEHAAAGQDGNGSDSNNSLPPFDDELDEDEWLVDEDELPSISNLLARAWFGSSSFSRKTASSAKKRNSGPFGFFTRQNSVGHAKSSIVPTWFKQNLRLPTLLRRSSSSVKVTKPLRLRVAEQVLSKEVVAAAEMIQRDILEADDPLPHATVKFLLRAAAGVGKGWAQDNLNRVFAGFGVYVAATCGIMHCVKQAAKWLAWRLPFGAKRMSGPVIGFTADVLLPTQFFGPFLATYIVLKVLTQKRQTASTESAEGAGAAGMTVLAEATATATTATADEQAVATAQIRSKSHTSKLGCYSKVQTTTEVLRQPTLRPASGSRRSKQQQRQQRQPSTSSSDIDWQSARQHSGALADDANQTYKPYWPRKHPNSKLWRLRSLHRAGSSSSAGRARQQHVTLKHSPSRIGPVSKAGAVQQH